MKDPFFTDEKFAKNASQRRKSTVNSEGRESALREFTKIKVAVENTQRLTKWRGQR